MAVHGRRALLVSASLLLLLLTAASPVAALHWPDSYPLGPWGTQPVGIVALDDTNVVAAFTNFQDQLVFRRSSNAGESWRAPVRLGLSGEYAVGGLGRFVDVVSVPDGRVLYTRSGDRGDTFGSPKNLATTDWLASWPAVARDDSGHVIVAWRERSGSGDAPSYRTRLRVSDDGGDHFGPITLLGVIPRGTDVPYLPGPSVAIGGGVIYVAFATSPTQLRLRTSTDGGTTWGADASISNTNYGVRTHIVLDGAAAYVAYTAFSDGTWSVGYKRSDDGGGTWSRRTAIAKGRVDAIEMTAKDGVLDAVFGHSTRRWWDFSTRYSHRAAGGAWTPAEDIPNAATSRFVRVADRLVMLNENWNGGDVGRATRAEVLVLHSPLGL